MTKLSVTKFVVKSIASVATTAIGFAVTQKLDETAEPKIDALFQKLAKNHQK